MILSGCASKVSVRAGKKAQRQAHQHDLVFESTCTIYMYRSRTWYAVSNEMECHTERIVWFSLSCIDNCSQATCEPPERRCLSVIGPSSSGQAGKGRADRHRSVSAPMYQQCQQAISDLNDPIWLCFNVPRTDKQEGRQAGRQTHLESGAHVHYTVPGPDGLHSTRRQDMSSESDSAVPVA